MVHGNKVILIRRYTLRIIVNVNNETHDCIWHAAQMSNLKDELEHYIEHCQMFSHHIMFIGAFIAWVRHPSILFTFILRRCNAFIISVIVVIRRSIIFTEHFLWHLIRVGKFPSMLNWFPACDVVQMSIFPYMSHDWLAWVLVITENDEKSKSGIFITQPMFITVLPYLPKIFASEGGKSQEFVKNISLCN